VSAPTYRPLSTAALADELAARCRAARTLPDVLRVAVDGADAARPGVLADAVAERLRAGGLPCARVSLADWLRPASLRLEHGRADEESYRSGWFDLAALDREVLGPLGPGGSGRWLPTLWDVARDRATRAERRTAAPGTVLLVDGPALLGRGLPFELTVHVHLSAAALLRRTPEDLRWTVPALLGHEEEVGTDELADVLVRAEHADRPALRTG
jgi:hypothetical protein